MFFFLFFFFFNDTATTEIYTLSLHDALPINKAGRWFVTSPGRVTIQRSAGELAVDCRKQCASAGSDVVASTLNTANLMGNVVVSAGLGYFVDKHSGAGYDYPATLTIIMRREGPPEEPDKGSTGNAIY